MANVTETSTWETGIYQLETNDPVEGGAGGISNRQATELGNRTKWLYDNTWRTGDVKEVDCDGAYIAANFDGTGLGINERIGWAICNGNNGTKNRNGRVSLGYDPSGAGIGTPSGSVNNSIPFTGYGSGGGNTSGGLQGRLIISTGNNEVSESLESVAKASSAPSVSVMQPSIVTLFIQKL